MKNLKGHNTTYYRKNECDFVLLWKQLHKTQHSSLFRLQLHFVHLVLHLHRTNMFDITRTAQFSPQKIVYALVDVLLPTCYYWILSCYAKLPYVSLKLFSDLTCHSVKECGDLMKQLWVSEILPNLQQDDRIHHSNRRIVHSFYTTVRFSALSPSWDKTYLLQSIDSLTSFCHD